MNIVWGLLVMAFGALMVIYARNMPSIFGKVAWAEANLRGGSTQFFKLLGVLVSIIGILWATNLVQGILLAFLLPLFGGTVN